MKIIFLDIDGVLNYRDSDIIDDRCLDNLKFILEKTEAKIVLISSWKHFLDDNILDNLKRNNNQKQLEEVLKYRDILGKVFVNELSILDVAPDLGEHRSDEIALWLTQNLDLGIESFVIIDDFNCEYDKNYPDKWIRPSWFSIGLTNAMAEKAIMILNSDI